MALMAPTQAAPTPHHTDRDPRFRAAGICSLPPPKTDWNHVTEKHLLPPPTVRRRLNRGSSGLFLLISTSRLLSTHRLSSPREGLDQDQPTISLHSHSPESVNPEVIYGSLFPIVKWASSINWSSTMQTACPHSTPLNVPPVRR